MRSVYKVDMVIGVWVWCMTIGRTIRFFSLFHVQSHMTQFVGCGVVMFDDAYKGFVPIVDRWWVGGGWW